MNPRIDKGRDKGCDEGPWTAKNVEKGSLMEFKKSVRRGGWFKIVGAILVLANAPNLLAAVSFRGTTGSYAPSNGHLGGGAENLSNWTSEVWIKPATTTVRQDLLDIHGNRKETSVTIGPGGSIGCLTTWPQTYHSTSSDLGVITAYFVTSELSQNL
jgi:hypothetical protein